MGFRNCAFISLRILEAIVAILTLTFAIYIIRLSQQLEALRQEGDTALATLLADYQTATDVVDAVNAFLEKALAVPDRIWFLFSVGIWTFLAISYKPAAVRWFPLRSGRVYIVPLETLTLLLWLLGFVAAASLAIELEPLCLALSSVSFFSKYLKVCLYVKIAAAITAVGCVLWIVTSIISCCVCGRKRAESKGPVEDGMEMKADPRGYGRIRN